MAYTTDELLGLPWTDTDDTPDGVFDLPSIDRLVEEMVPQSEKEWARHNLLLFILKYLNNVATNKFAEVHYEVARILQEPSIPGQPKRVLILFPREHAKTTIITLAYILWCICYQVKRNIVICSDSKLQAKEFLRNIKTELETNEKIRQDFGELVPDTSRKGNSRGKWDETHVITANQVQIKLISPNSQVRGLQFVARSQRKDGTWTTESFRPDLIILDDILNDKWIKNKIQRDKTEEWLFGPLINAADSNKGDILLVGTILHHDDILSRLWKDDERTARWTKMRKPACRVENGTIKDPLWPERWSSEKLLRRKIEIGSLAFSREFLLQPVDEGAKFFSYEWFKYYIHRDLPTNYWQPLTSRGMNPLPDDMFVVTSIDPAISKKDTADYTAIATMGFSPSTRSYYVLDLFRDRVSPETQVQEMLRQCKAWDRTKNIKGYGHEGFVVETYQYQESLKYWLKKYLEEQNMGYYRIHERKEQQVDKNLRVSGMSPMVEQRRLHFPFGMKRDLVTGQYYLSKMFQICEDELNDFPNGANDDTVDALQRCYSALVKIERRYVYQGFYGPEAMVGFDALLKTFGFMNKDVA